MSIRAVLLPLFVEILLTFGLYFWMAYYRVTLVRGGTVRARDVALREPNWPPHVLKVTNAAHNQLEIPMLFYVLTILAVVTHHADLGPLFGVGLIVLFVMWIIFIVRILSGLP